MNAESAFFPLLLITLLAVVVPVIVSRIRPVRVPIVVGEIVAGIILGQSGFNLLHHTATLDFLAEFGFTFLMFLSGLEVDFSVLRAAPNPTTQRPRWQQTLPLAGISFMLTLACASGVGLILWSLDMARNPLLMGLILSTTSLGIVVPILKERHLTTTDYGQFLLIAALISDFVTLVLLSIVIAVLSHGPSLDLLLFLVLLLGFVVAARLGRWFTANRVVTRIGEELSYATAQIRVRGAFALMVLWVALAEGLGVEIILGAFLAGVLVSLTSTGQHSPLREKLDAIGYGFFIPIFFIMVGAQFDLQALVQSREALLLVPILLVAAYAVKILPAMLYRVRFSWRETLGAGVLLSSRLSLIIAASAIALELGAISSATNAAVVLVAVITCTMSPILFARMMPTPPVVRRKGIIVVGADQRAIVLSARLHRADEDVRVITDDSAHREHLRASGIKVIEGSAEHATLDAAGAANAAAVMVFSADAALALEICRNARDSFAIPLIALCTDDVNLATQAQALGAHVIQPVLATVLALEGTLRFPTTFTTLMNHDDAIDIVDVRLANPAFDRRPLRALSLPGNALVLGVKRANDVLVPNGATVLQRGDILMVIGTHDALGETQHLLSST